MPNTELLDMLLRKRGILDETQRKQFLNPSYEGGLHNPFLLKDMERACVRIFEATEAKEKIVVYADYDCDGIPGAVIFSDFFKKIGYSNFDVYIPDRADEGYGLHMDAVKQFIADGVKLIITVDLGITAVLEVAEAQTAGVDVIITDHHLPHSDLPRAYAIINPKQVDCEYPEKMLCGAAVAWKVVVALVEKYGEYWNVKKGWEKWLLDMAGLATLSDMVPLLGENRVLAYFGMMVLRKSPRPGLRELLSKLAINQTYLSEDDVSFMITPRINAASRMGSPRRAYELLATTDIAEAISLAQHLSDINDDRKSLVATIMRDVHAHLKKRELREVIVIGNPAWRAGVLGLVAGKITDTYSRPAFVWGGDDGSTSPDQASKAGRIKGSCRSDGSVNVVELMTSAENTFIDFGGHELAGGFSLTTDSVHFLEDTLVDAFSKIKKTKSEISLAPHDATLSLSDVTIENHTLLQKLSPFGLGNQKPLFLFEQVLLKNVRTFGKEKNHLELILADQAGSIKAISFFSTPASYKKELVEGEPISFLGTFDYSRFRGRGELRLRLVDVF